MTFSPFLDKKRQRQNKMSEKRLTRIKSKISGRGFGDQVSIRHRGGAEKRRLREIDFKRDKRGVGARVVGIEYDPNRTADIALLCYNDGEKRYILAPEGLKEGDQVMAGENVEVKLGNHLPLGQIPIGIAIHNLELTAGKGGQVLRSAGSSGTILSRENGFAVIRLPSSEVRRFSLACWATIGQIGNIEKKHRVLGKAGRKRHFGVRPTVRGVAQHPDSHPHGGGEGRSGIGMPSPKTPWGKKTRGKRTRKRRKYSHKLIIKRRK